MNYVLWFIAILAISVLFHGVLDAAGWQSGWVRTLFVSVLIVPFVYMFHSYFIK